MNHCHLVDYFLFKYVNVACALLMFGEDLENHTDVKNILVEMGVYFQVQVNCKADIGIGN